MKIFNIIKNTHNSSLKIKAGSIQKTLKVIFEYNLTRENDTINNSAKKYFKDVPTVAQWKQPN